MLLDYLGKEIRVGDYIVYGAGRGYLEYGLVIDVIQDAEGLGHYGNRTGKIKLVRLERNQVFVWDDVSHSGRYKDLGGWKAKRINQSNTNFTIVLSEDMILNNNNFLLLRRFKQEILRGDKIVGNEIN